ncbi:MAG: translation elongation factor Ts [Pseudomonadota bacterium]
MAAISASMVKELRDKTGAGMMDCKAALGETNGDMEAAVDWLRTKGLAKAAKKAGRVAADGLVAALTEGTAGALVEINSETDFVARNETFQGLVKTIGTVALTQGGDFDATRGAAFPGADETVEEHVKSMVGTIGENLSFRRSVGLSVDKGIVASYVHGQVVSDQGKIGVLVALESEADGAALADLGRKLAMHVAAAAPLAARVDELDPAAIEREREVLAQQARDSGKPENIIDKMVQGRLRKFYQEVVLLSQVFVVDPDNTVEQVIENAAKELGSPIKLAGFARFAIGEGIEKEEADFAAEVSAAVKS